MPEDATNSPVNYWESSGAIDIVLWTGPRGISTSVTDGQMQPDQTIPTRQMQTTILQPLWHKLQS